MSQPVIPAHRNVCPSTYAFTLQARGPYRLPVAPPRPKDAARFTSYMEVWTGQAHNFAAGLLQSDGQTYGSPETARHAQRPHAIRAHKLARRTRTQTSH